MFAPREGRNLIESVVKEIRVPPWDVGEFRLHVPSRREEDETAVQRIF